MSLFSPIIFILSGTAVAGKMKPPFQHCPFTVAKESLRELVIISTSFWKCNPVPSILLSDEPWSTPRFSRLRLEDNDAGHLKAKVTVTSGAASSTGFSPEALVEHFRMGQGSYFPPRHHSDAASAECSWHHHTLGKCFAFHLELRDRSSCTEGCEQDGLQPREVWAGCRGLTSPGLIPSPSNCTPSGRLPHSNLNIPLALEDALPSPWNIPHHRSVP
ncbi:uncharacterized protein LOC102899270 [Felis catus]|uniref:uncharacterized protein LOC102899270 n=1 Tax=Felis catus TaxID=9685 RepID=UPI001D1990FB|nr:uncharacterized protein LOC102899270 [Felis catus]